MQSKIDFIFMNINEKINEEIGELKNNVFLIKANAVLLALRKDKVNLKLSTIKALCEDRTTKDVYNHLKRKHHKPSRYFMVLFFLSLLLLLLGCVYWFKYYPLSGFWL